MKKNLFVKDLTEKARVEDAFLISKKESGMSKAGKAYLIVRAMDSTGEVECRVWDNVDRISPAFEKDDVALVKGFVVSYQGRLQINVTDIKRLPPEEFDMRDYLPASPRDPGEMLKELDRVVGSVKDPHIKALLESVFSDRDIREKFAAAPAAKGMHHPYLGGLLEHVLSMCGLVDHVVEHYAGQGTVINRDLLMAGAIFHDIGKVEELTYSAAFDYTDEGRLIGHITMGVELMDRKASAIEGFPRETLIHLKHMVLSHHGQYEYGSPKRPKTLEAIVLSYLDDLDAKVNAVRAVLEAEKDNPSNWTPYQRIFERFIYKRSPGIYDEEPPSAEAAPDEGAGEGEGENENGNEEELSLFGRRS